MRRPSPNSRALRAAAACAVALALAPGCSSCWREEPPAPKPPAALAQLVEVAGSATLTRAGGVSPAAAGPLFAGDVLNTFAASRAVLRFSDGKEIEVGENTQFKLSEAPGEITVDIAQGVITSRVPTGVVRGLALAILTPFGISRVAAGGGEATLSVGAQGATLEVHTGEIVFVSKEGQSHLARGGEQLEVHLGTIRLVRAPAPEAATTAEPVEVQLRADRGRVLSKRPGEAGFSPVSAAQSAPDGTAFRIARGGRALLSSPGFKVRVAGPGDGQLVRARRESGRERFELAPPPGLSQVQLGVGAREVSLPGPAGPASLASDGEATITWLQERREVHGEVHAGRIALTYGGQAKSLKAGEQFDLGRTLAVRPRPRSSIALPPGKAVRVFGLRPLDVVLSWPATGEAPMRVEVASDPGFADVLVSGPVEGGALPIAAPLSGELHWRAFGADGQVAAVGHALFARELSLTASGQSPVSEVAETGLKASVYYQSALPAIRFAAASVAKAARYRLRVYRPGALDRPVVERASAEPQVTLEAGVLGEGSYLWRAAALDAHGRELSGGRMNKLEIAYDNAMTVLTIEQPAPGEVLEDRVRAKGVAPLGSRLFINGQRAPLDEKGRFDLYLPRALQVVFRVVLPSGAEGYWSRRLRAP